jgi:hypothetical protein
MKFSAAFAGLALLGALGTAQALPVDVTYTISGSSGDWTYDFTVTNNLGDTNYIYALLLDSFSPSNFAGAPAGWIQDNPIILEWCYSSCFHSGPTNLAPGNTLSGFLAHDTAAAAFTIVEWRVAAEGGNLGNPIFAGVAVGSLTPVPGPLAGAGLSGLILLASGSLLAYGRRRQDR